MKINVINFKEENHTVLGKGNICQNLPDCLTPGGNHPTTRINNSSPLLSSSSQKSGSGPDPQYLSDGRSNQKNSKNEVHLFFNFGSGRTLTTQSTGPNPFNWSPNSFLQISRYWSLKSEKFKRPGAFFSSNFASGRTLPTQSTGPQLIQLVPKHRFLVISQ